MKTALSLPDPLFDEGERFRQRHKKSRSQLYAAALREYLSRHAPGSITAAMNAVIDEVAREPDSFAHVAAYQVLGGTEWEP